jgi:phosphatidylinositol glycan class O
MHHHAGFEEMNMIAGGVLMVLNTFGCYFLFVPFLPLLLFYRSSSSSSWSSSKRSKDGGERRYTREEVRGWTLRVVWTFMLAFVVKLFLTTLFVFLVRRHLMVWKVFAPKYIFDASATALIDLLLVLLYLFAYTFL